MIKPNLGPTARTVAYPGHCQERQDGGGARVHGSPEAAKGASAENAEALRSRLQKHERLQTGEPHQNNEWRKSNSNSSIVLLVMEMVKTMNENVDVITILSPQLTTNVT